MMVSVHRATSLALPVLALPALLAVVACAPFDRGDPVDLPGGPPPVDHGVDADPSLTERVDRAVRGFLSDSGAPGIGVALVKDGAVLFDAGYGWAEIETERPLGVDTPVLLSSVSKTFIGVAAMQAKEQGVLTFDEPISDLVGFAVDNPKVRGETITLYHALTHGTGIEDTRKYTQSYAAGDPTIGLMEFEREYLTPGGDHWRRSNYARRAPGEEFSYSNVGAALGALAIGHAQGQEFMDLVHEQILDPLGMDDSAYLLADLEQEPAVPYDPIRVGGDFRPWPHYGYPTYPDGMLRASARDMGRYIAAIESGGTVDGASILSPQGIDEMLTVDPAVGTDEDGQAVVWAMRRMGGRQLLGHNGGDYGSTTEMWIDREAGVGVAVLLNTELRRRDEDRLLDLQVALLDIAESAESAS